MRRRAAPSGAALLLFFATSAVAAPRLRTLGGTVHVHPGITCLDEATLQQQIRTWLEADSVDGDLRVEVDGSNEDARFASFRMWRGSRLIAHRRFAPGPAQCAQMHAVLGLAVALALKVSLRDELLGELAPPSLRAWSFGLGARMAWAVLPGTAWGGVVWLERALPEHFAVHLGVSGLAGSKETFEGVGGTFSTASLGLEIALCAVPALGTEVRGRLCTGLEGGGLFASGSGFTVSKDAVLGWLAVSTSIGVSVEVRPGWSLVGAVGVVVPVAKTQIAVADPGGRVVDTRNSTPAGGMLTLGGAYEF